MTPCSRDVFWIALRYTLTKAMVVRFLSSGGPDGNRALAHCKQHCIDERKKENSMRKIIVSEYVTLDGVMEDPGGAEGFKHGGWSFGFGVQNSSSINSRNSSPAMRFYWVAGPMKGLPPPGRRCLGPGRMVRG